MTRHNPNIAATIMSGHYPPNRALVEDLGWIVPAPVTWSPYV